MNDSQGVVALGDRVNDHADRRKVVDLLEVDLLLQHLLIDAPEVLGPALDQHLDIRDFEMLFKEPVHLGDIVLALSSGTARAPNQNGYQSVGGYDKKYTSGTPAGYPKQAPSCMSGGLFGSFGGSHDGAALQVKIRVPSNAKSFKYQQNFFTYEFPDFICSEFNDFFVTIMDPKPAALPDGNIAFDQDGNPISVNNSLLQVCSPQTAGGKMFGCPLGNSFLSGTGFEGHAATGWLTTTAPVDTVRGKEITLMWAIWDQGDGILDSTALIDDFQWSVDAASGTQTVPTGPK